SDGPAARPDRLTVRPDHTAVRSDRVALWPDHTAVRSDRVALWPDRFRARSAELGGPARVVWEPSVEPGSSVGLATNRPRLRWGRGVPPKSLAKLSGERSLAGTSLASETAVKRVIAGRQLAGDGCFSFNILQATLLRSSG